MYYLKDDKEYHIIPADLKQTFENKFNLNIGKNEIIKMKNNNIITDRDIKIATFLFQNKFATVGQIYKLLDEDKTKVNLKNRLDKLVKYRVLNKFMLSDLEQEKIEVDAFVIYCLDLGGRYLLAHYSNEDTSDWYSTVNMKSSEIISKNILSTEIFLRVFETCGNKLEHFILEPEFRVGKKNVTPSFEMCLNIGGNKKYFIGEAFREYDFPIYAREKINKLESFLVTNSWKKYFYDTDQAPILFIFTDSDLSAQEAGKIITETSEIENFRLSTDERIQKVLYELGAFLKYDIVKNDTTEKKMLQEIKAVTFKP